MVNFSSMPVLLGVYRLLKNSNVLNIQWDFTFKQLHTSCNGDKTVVDKSLWNDGMFGSTENDCSFLFQKRTLKH